MAAPDAASGAEDGAGTQTEDQVEVRFAGLFRTGELGGSPPVCLEPTSERGASGRRFPLPIERDRKAHLGD